jgi:hypothetical protein
MTPSFSLPKGPQILDVSGVDSIRAFSMERECSSLTPPILYFCPRCPTAIRQEE